MNNELYHHGILGMKWGVRRFQDYDGVLTSAGRKHIEFTPSYYKDYDSKKGHDPSSKPQNVGEVETTVKTDMQKTLASSMQTKLKDAFNSVRTMATGRQYVDGYLDMNTSLARIQTSKEFEKFAFYATYNKDDQNKYLGLFGQNLISRANAEAKNAEKVAKKTGNAEDIENAKTLREKADGTKVYQLKLSTTNKLRIPSDENASNITANLLKEPDFKKNLEASIADSKEKMRRPTQQVLFEQAQNALRKDPDKLSKSEKVAIYKALNLSLVNHNEQEIAAQDRFYSELKKNGYGALLDYNDKDFSSYHAKRPMIIFDTDSVKLDAVLEPSPKTISKLNTKYNAERIVKEIPANTVGFVSKLGTKTVSEAASSVKQTMNDYLYDRKRTNE